MININAHVIRNMRVVESHMDGVATLTVTGPANQMNRGAHAVGRVAREALTKALGFSPAKLGQSYHFSNGRYIFAATYSTAL